MIVSKTKKTYRKHHVKRDPATLKFLSKDDGKPVLGDFIREARITENVANELNPNWENSGVYWELVEKTEKEIRAEFFREADQLIKDGKLEKSPAKNIKTEDLKELIKNNK